MSDSRIHGFYTNFLSVGILISDHGNIQGFKISKLLNGRPKTYKEPK